jgi:hypothetical protein
VSTNGISVREARRDAGVREAIAATRSGGILARREVERA